MPQVIQLADQWRPLALRPAVVLLAVLLTALSTFLFVRRLMGAFDQALSGSSLLAVAILTLLAVTACRVGILACYEADRPVVRWACVLVPAVCVVLIGFALTLPASPMWSKVLLWVLFVGSEAAWVVWLLRLEQLTIPMWRSDSRPATTPVASERRGADSAEIEAELDDARDSDHDRDLESDELRQEGMLQQWTRTLDEAGQESVHGILREEFSLGERLRQVHVAICPPLEQVPTVEVFQSDGPACSIKVAQRETFGLRFEVRLSAVPEESVWVEVEFVAYALRAATADSDSI